jgi:hypothetical protein
MVNEGSSNMRFVNTHESDIYIHATASSFSLTMEIYGRKGNYSIKRVSEVTEVIKAPPLQIVEGDCEQIIQSEKAGLKSIGYLIYYDENGNVIATKKIRTDSYMPVQGIIQKTKNAVMPDIVNDSTQNRDINAVN